MVRARGPGLIAQRVDHPVRGYSLRRRQNICPATAVGTVRRRVLQAFS
jgi:hypothetical protein